MIESAKRNIRYGIYWTSGKASTGARKVKQGVRKAIRGAKKLLTRNNFNRATETISSGDEYPDNSSASDSIDHPSHIDHPATPDRMGAIIALMQGGLPPDISCMIVKIAGPLGRDFSEEIKAGSQQLLRVLSQACANAASWGSGNKIGASRVRGMTCCIRVASNIASKLPSDEEKAIIQTYIYHMQEALEKGDPKAAWVEMFRLYQTVAFIENGPLYADKFIFRAEHPALFNAIEKQEKDENGNILRLEITPGREATL